MLFYGKVGRNKVLIFQNNVRNYPKQQCKHSIKNSSVSLACCEKKQQAVTDKQKLAKPNQKHIIRVLFGGNPTHLAIPKRKF